MSPAILAPELLLVIFGHVEDKECLFNLASSSKRFNHLALDVYFASHGLDTNNIVMEPDPDDPGFKQGDAYLHALLISLALKGKDINSLTYRFNFRDKRSIIMEQTIAVARLIRRLGRIRGLRLTMFVPIHSLQTVMEEVNADLLDAVFNKSCQELYLSSDDLPMFSPFQVGQRMDPDAWTMDYYNHSARIPYYLRAVNKLPIFDTNRKIQPNPNMNLRRLKSDTFSPTFREFFSDMHRVNGLKLLTHLQLVNIYDCPQKDFLAAMKVNLPSLTVLIIRSCSRAYQRSLLDFISRHGGIVTLCFLLYTTDSDIHCLPVSKMPSRPLYMLRNLQQICVNPSYMPHFFESASSISPISLTKVTLQSTLSTYRDEKDAFYNALKALQSCPTRIELVLYSPLAASFSEFKTWFESIDRDSDPSESLPKLSLPCVRSLSLTYQFRDFDDDEITELPTWLGLFPDLEEVRLEIFVSQEPHAIELGASSSKWSKLISKAAAEKIKAVCPTIQKFGVVKGGKKRLVWSFDGANAVLVS
ncbi:hypothetical protein CVT24_008557 [Panaeolus cyanescens]|uniref:F-box domain-containing protein n=1 Tax=Panaeolus cyanescens TaxID=181874 RepID=A0A409VB69_9AGAR|nr:hypothetical protein CVT24_008557 [Panaeolus cyanescens]